MSAADELRASAPVPEGPPEIPEEPEGSPELGPRPEDHDDGRPPGPTPARDFWDALYTRRSIRKFRADPVPRELVAQVMHAGIWAPSSCNYQMWDLVAVDDAHTNAALCALSSQMGNAPVNIVVSYGRDFSEEQWANVQSASALIQNMSLAAHVLGLGTFWITQMGGRERVRELVGLPYDRVVVAVVALGYPALAPKAGPRRRPLAAVAHWNHYAGRPIPSSPDPACWTDDDLALYQRARVLNGLRHNKPRAWETRALERMLARFLPPAHGARGGPPPQAAATGAGAPRWLDVLPCTGILTEHLARARPAHRFDVVERTRDVAAFVGQRVRPPGATFLWPTPGAPPPAAAYDVVTCLFRLENLDAPRRAELFAALARWTRPGGHLVVGFVNRRSFHDWGERLRARRGGPRGVEYVLSPDPNIGPFESLSVDEVLALARASGFELVQRLGTQAAPEPDEVAFRARNFRPRAQRLARLSGRLLRLAARLPGAERACGRFQFLKLVRRDDAAGAPRP